MKKSLTFFTSVAIGIAAAWAVEPTEEIRQYASNYYAYPYPANPVPALTQAPEGYAPFHIEHYGRHGSRWHIGRNAYARPLEMLEKAGKAGKLTPRGQELLEQMRVIEAASRGRDGELTDVGAEQHRGIAKRMYENFPEVFVDGANIDARSTVVIRCILSMENELMTLLVANPNLNVVSDASYADMPYMNFADTDTVAHQAADKWDEEWDRWAAERPRPTEFLSKIVTDTAWANDSLKVSSLFHYLFNIAANAQSHKDMPAPYDIFTEKELRDRWEYNNASWFTRYGNTSRNDGLASFSQRRLLRNFINAADSTLASVTPSANLRFGHEVCVMPLVVLMELDHYGDEINSLDEVSSKWKNYEIFPMASNVQLIFYRSDKAGEPVLVKALLNEKERSLPAKPIAPGSPYYKWDDVKAYWLAKLQKVDDAWQPAERIY